MQSLYLDFLRIVAIFMVVYLHTGKYGVQVYAYSTSAIERALGYFFAIITSEVPVPLFFMISGALLLEKEESLSQLFQKRILKILFILLFFCYVPIQKLYRSLSIFSLGIYFHFFYRANRYLLLVPICLFGLSSLPTSPAEVGKKSNHRRLFLSIDFKYWFSIHPQYNWSLDSGIHTKL